MRERGYISFYAYGSQGKPEEGVRSPVPGVIKVFVSTRTWELITKSRSFYMWILGKSRKCSQY